MEELLVFLIALAQHHQLHRELHHIMKHFTNQVQTLVGNQTAHNGHNRYMGLLPQSHKALEIGLVGILAGHVLQAEIHGDAGVLGGVVPVHINPVEHAGELVFALAHHALHAVGKIGQL